MDHELEAERRCVRAKNFMRQATDGATGENPSSGQQQQPPTVPPQAQAPANPPANPANPVIVNEYNSFNLANVTAPISPKWKNNENLLDEYQKFRHSCQRIFDVPMCHVTSGKVKTNMFLIWASPNGEDIYDNFKLTVAQCHDTDCDAVV